MPPTLAALRAPLSLTFALLYCAGCQWTPQARLTAAEARQQTLIEQNKALIAENENLKVHNRRVEDRLIEAERDVALLDGQLTNERRASARGQRQDVTSRAPDRSTRSDAMDDPRETDRMSQNPDWRGTEP